MATAAPDPAATTATTTDADVLVVGAGLSGQLAELTQPAIRSCS
jgi:hypothetical protein